MPEDLFQILFVKTRRNSEKACLCGARRQAFSIETPVRAQYMAMGVEPQKIIPLAAGYGDNSTWHCFLFRYGYLKKDV